MADTDRKFSWRQGDALTDEAAKALNLQYPENPGATVVVVISHDCDLTAVAEKEPESEIIVGKMATTLGSCTAVFSHAASSSFHSRALSG